MPSAITEEKVKSRYEAFYPKTEAGNGYKAVIVSILADLDYKGDDLRDLIVEDLPAAIMLHNSLIGTEGKVASRLLRDLIVLRDITYIIPSTNRQVHRSLIDMLYKDATEQAAAVEIFDDQLKVFEESGSAPRHGINNSTGNSGSSANSSGSDERSDTSQIVESRAAHNICMRFCKPESKCTGKMNQSLNEFVNNYLTAADDY
jgi:hypothetical protein